MLLQSSLIHDKITFKLNSVLIWNSAQTQGVEGSPRYYGASSQKLLGYMFTTYNRVRMHDTDMAGILYFAAQFRFVHDALEDFVTDLGFSIPRLLASGDFIFVIRHAQADYLAPLTLGDELKVDVFVEALSTSSFSLRYEIFRESVLVGKAKTVHVTIDKHKRHKIPLPPSLHAALEERRTKT